MSENQTLCDFVVTEMIHDYGSARGDSIVPGPNNINMLSATRYNKNKEIFNKILSSGVPNCKSFTKYDEPGILKYIAGANIQQDIKTGKVDSKILTTINGNEYHVKIADKNYEKNIDNGEEFFDDLAFGYYTEIDSPVLLPDVHSWVYGMFKKGQNGGDRKIFMFSPLVVMADSAVKANITNKKSMQDFFDNPSGVELINVIDKARFMAPQFDLNEEVFGFFSKFSILNTYNENKKQVNQLWSGLEYQGRGITSILRPNVHEANNMPTTFNRITQLINSKPPQTEKKNASVADKLAQDNPQSNKERELFNIEIQSKRSGDWLPVVYILNYKNHDPELLTYIDPNDPSSLDTYDEETYFKKENMYILTIDTPLVAYSLYSGVNVLYITADGKLVKFEADPRNPQFNL